VRERRAEVAERGCRGWVIVPKSQALPQGSFGALDHSNGSARLLDAAEVAELLRVPKSWVYAETRAGRLPHVKLGRYYRYAPDSIAAFVAGLERGPVPYRKYPAPGGGPGGSADG
jgi:excisionase family DNA binding protein